jgi:hypothetical protein|tara:strand:- start:347 stop:2332 length:1986 start_codon:yes stop_codon:yes gene_type:complete
MVDEPTNIEKQPGEDVPVKEGDDDLSVMNAIRQYKTEAEDARRDRLRRNKDNRGAYMGQQDWTHKKKGQSKEFLPKTPAAVEQWVSFVKRALTQFGDWYEIELGRMNKGPLSGAAIRRLLDCFLDNLIVEDNKESAFSTLLSDGIKVGSLESLVIFKVHGNLVKETRFEIEPGQVFLDPVSGQRDETPERLVDKSMKRWKLRIDLVRPEDYLVDPTGAGLYEIHSVERDLHYVIDRAKEGTYDRAAVELLTEDFQKKRNNERRDPEDMGQNETSKPSFRKRVVIDEFWGTILDSDGKVVHKNVVCVMANNKYLLRKPRKNPFWHQESPFVATPLIRVPFSVWHKALFDHAVELNFVANELFNLIIDGGISAVWGIKQLKVDALDDPRQVSDGIPQGETLVVKGSFPAGDKVLETVAQGQVPGDAMAVLEMLSREFSAAALSNELKMGNLPGKQVRATEIVELSQSQAVTLDGIIADIEQDLVSKTLRKSWLTICQFMDKVPAEEVICAIGTESAFALSNMTPKQRFAAYSYDCAFRVHGLSAVLAKARDFQKIMALMQAVSTNPILLQAFFTKYSPDRLLSHVMKTLAVNPEQMARDEEEMVKMHTELQNLATFQALTSGNTGGTTNGGGAGPGAESVGEPGLPAEINQLVNPATGMTSNQ